MPKILFGDYETRSTADIKKQGADVYARHPSTEVLAFGYAFDSDPVSVLHFQEPPAQRVVDHVAQNGTFVAHNALFEWLIWNYVWRRFWPELPILKIDQMICTMAMSYAMALPGKLEKAAPAAGLKVEKDMKGHRIMLQVSQPKDFKDCMACKRSGTDDQKYRDLGRPNCVCDGSGQKVIWWEPDQYPEKFERLYNYCAQDVEVERQLFGRLLPLSRSEREMWILDHTINQRGVRVDLASAKQAIAIVDFETKRLNNRIREVTSNAVGTCTAHAQLTDWLRSRGVETEGVAKSDVADLLETETLPLDCRRALETRQHAAKSSTAKFSALLKRTCPDGQLRSTTQYHGAGTGRWAGRGFQLHNLPRPRLSQNELDGIFEVLK